MSKNTKKDSGYSDLICVMCGRKVEVLDHAKAGSLLLPSEKTEMGEGGPHRYMATCDGLHGHGRGSTPKEALAAYAKDQEWGMRKIERLEELEARLREFDLEAERLRITQANYHLRKKVDAVKRGRS